ncbi:IPExxxVDY family protein [Sphingobacterium sp. SYP-B4668]|uniref:IPExxxVDY family protein n=1 Tax=Sphingobacterium sp. SYP-B4668 TaxID=2996035 RepID=UPI0022DD434A|nr:IPExxxVDY family protein [Sphingobacterium sp. SYP-B4668]
MNKITVFKLEMDMEEELDFVLLGISSPLRDYRLCHFLNKNTGLRFIYGKESDLDHKGNSKEGPKEEYEYHIIQEKSRNKKPALKHHFAIYRDCDPNYEYEYYLINNRSLEGGILIPEIANFDFFMVIKHFIHEDDLNTLIQQINRINDIIMVKEIVPKILKSKENLIF